VRQLFGQNFQGEKHLPTLCVLISMFSSSKFLFWRGRFGGSPPRGLWGGYTPRGPQLWFSEIPLNSVQFNCLTNNLLHYEFQTSMFSSSKI